MIRNFLLYLTYPVTVNTPTVTYMTHPVPVGHVDHAEGQDTFHLHVVVVVVVEAAGEKFALVFALIVGTISVIVIAFFLISYLPIEKKNFFLSSTFSSPSTAVCH
jgi:hypothetical protein